MSECRENDESILNTDTGISSDSAHSFTLSFFLFIFKKKTMCSFCFLLNVVATGKKIMYIFKNCEC